MGKQCRLVGPEPWTLHILYLPSIWVSRWQGGALEMYLGEVEGWNLKGRRGSCERRSWQVGQRDG